MKLPDASVYWQGWVKYFHYNNATHFERPRAFFQNNQFYAQRIRLQDKGKSDAYGTLRIPSRFSFFLVVYKDSLTIFSSRYNINKRVYDTLKLDHIGLVPEDKTFQGGIKDLGNFNEGNCFEMEVNQPLKYNKNYSPIHNQWGRRQTWIFCTPTKKSKGSLMKLIAKLKLKSQRKHGAVITMGKIQKIKKGKTTLSELIPKKRKISKVGNKPVNGYWILLQDWTECTLKCGGGLSYQQFMCVPPKHGGKPCRGQRIKTRPCNTQKCPPIGNYLKLRLKRLKKESEKPLVPMVKVAPFSNRPQRYSKCVLKETDAFWGSYNPATRETTKQPIRLVMNNQTVSIFADDKYENKIYTYRLDYTNIFRSKEFCCVKLRDNHKYYEFCGFPANCGTRTNNKWANDWIKHFNFFKTTCKTGFQEQGLLNPQDEKSLQIDFTRSFGMMNQNLQDKMIAEKQKLIIKNVRKAEKNELQRKVAATQNMGFTVLTKEAELENLISKEERAKESIEINDMMKKIRNEKKKRKCLKKNLKLRKKDTERLLQKRQGEKEIQEIKEEVKLEIDLKRKQMKRQIDKLRKRAKRKKAALQTRLNRIRTKMARDIMAANRNGDMQLCRKGKSDTLSRETYCDTHFITDYMRNFDCKTGENFCYLCCETEYGNNFIDMRDVCYDMCDGKPVKNKSTLSVSKKRPKSSSNNLPKNNLGGWVWVKHQNNKLTAK